MLRTMLALLLTIFIRSAASSASYFCGSTCILPAPNGIVQQGTPGGSTGDGAPLVLDMTKLEATCSGPSAACSTIVMPAVKRVFSRVFYRNVTSTTAPTLSALRVIVKSSAELQHGVDESYTLSVPAPANRTNATVEMTITAQSQWGALRGLETFAASVGLISYGEPHFWFHEDVFALQLWPPVRIEDSPRTAWRGLMIDTSRHFLSVSTILQAIDGMSMAKLNVLHWHIVDNSGWPLCIPSAQHVCDLYAYKDPWGNRAGYDKQDLERVVAYATARGVRIVPEFDLPGHIERPLCGAEPQLCVKGCAPDPSKAEWWAYLRAIIAELADIFPDRFFHGGADEFRPDCWTEDKGVQAWMKTKGFTKASEVLDFFFIEWQKILLEKGRRPMFWDEFLFQYNGDPPTRVNLTILDGTTATVRGISNGGSDEYKNDYTQWNQTLSAGIPAITTGISEMWYLDRAGKLCSGEDGNDPKASYYSYWWQTWQTYYSHDPFVGLSNETFDNSSLMLGSEVDMWGEGIDDTNFIPHVFPTLSAVGERMWSAARMGSLPDIQDRLAWHRCALVRNGLNAPPTGHPDGPGPPCNRIAQSESRQREVHYV